MSALTSRFSALADVCDEIRSSFPRSPVPTAVASQPDCCPECGELNADFLARVWTDITVEDIAQHRDDMFLMSPEAFHYYMPAYFVHFLENPAETDVAVYGILTCLTIPAIGKLPVPCVGEHATDFFLTFSRRERQAIHSFLRYIVESPFGDDDEFATRLIRAVGFWKTLAEL